MPFIDWIVIFILFGGTHGVIVSIIENRHSNRVQIREEAVFISHSVNSLGERYESNYSPSRYG